VVRVEKIDVNTRLYELEASRRKHLLISADALLEEEMWAEIRRIVVLETLS
jgi:hypothetical protein